MRALKMKIEYKGMGAMEEGTKGGTQYTGYEKGDYYAVFPGGVRFNLGLRLEATYTKVLKAFSQRLNEIDPGKGNP